MSKRHGVRTPSASAERLPDVDESAPAELRNWVEVAMAVDVPTELAERDLSEAISDADLGEVIDVTELGPELLPS